ncbi:hypothetical protein CS542_07210 [Pedobacter sp. IW39]|nr:hypothetical protein CS542_07210 [Pedobacter sp. IW39]
MRSFLKQRRYTQKLQRQTIDVETIFLWRAFYPGGSFNQYHQTEFHINLKLRRSLKTQPLKSLRIDGA